MTWTSQVRPVAAPPFPLTDTHGLPMIVPLAGPLPVAIDLILGAIDVGLRALDEDARLLPTADAWFAICVASAEVNPTATALS